MNGIREEGPDKMTSRGDKNREAQFTKNQNKT
jgi:hypothetical protein